MADVVTSIRIDADTKAAVSELSRMDAGMNVLSKRAVPALGGAFGALSSQAISMTTGFSGASGVLATMGQTMLTMSPIIGGVAIAAAAVTTIILKQKDSFAEATEVIRVNRDALQAVADANVELSAKAKELIAIRDKAVQQELLAIEVKIKLAEAGLREAGLWDKLLAMALAGGGVYTAAAAQTAMVTVAGDAQTKMLTELIAKWSDFNKEIGTFEKAKDTAKTAADLAKEIAKLNEANDSAVASMIAESLTKQAENAQKLLDIETQRAQLRSQTAASGGDVFSIIEASNAAIAAEQAAYEQRLANTNVFDGSRQVIEANYTLWLEQELAKRNASTLKSLTDQAAANKAAAAKELTAHKAKSAIIQQLGTSHLVQLLTLQKVTAGEVIKGVADETRQFLAIKAVQWAAEAIAYAFTPGRQAEASAKATAAAMAGGGAIAISAISNQFSDRNDAGLGSVESSIATGGDGSSRSSGRTLVSQGPVTLYYSATFVVNGHVFDKADIFNEFSMWNMENLRRAGVDAGQRAR